MRMLSCGDTALLVELGGLDEVLGLYDALSDRGLDGVVDLVPAARTILVRFDPRATSAANVAETVAATEPTPGPRRGGPQIELPVRYDGEDLAAAGELTGLGPRGVVAAHTGQTWTVAFCGFAPGFGYLVGDNDRLRVPRRHDPRTRVPAGAVGLAGEFTGVYPRESPGGWQLIGRALMPVWDLARTPPALLVPGARVRFREVR